MKTVIRLVLNDLRRDWKRPWTILLYAALPLAMATLMAAVFGGRGGSSAMPTIHVALLDQDKVVRAASPSGATATVDWDTSELVGRSVVLLVEDQSPTGGLAFDEVVTW